MARSGIFEMYEEASIFLKQGDYHQALTKFNQVVSEGANIDDDMVLRVVNAALRQREKCQFRLLKF